MNKKLERAIAVILRWSLALVFLYAAVGKIANPGEFAEQIDNYRLLPWILVGLVAVVLPWLELFSALALLSGRWLRGASLWIMVMNTVFIIAIASAMIRGLDIECGCFAVQAEASRVGLQRLAEDFLFLLAAGMIYWHTLKSETLDG
jgi:putative oxidoreductase